MADDSHTPTNLSLQTTQMLKLFGHGGIAYFDALIAEYRELCFAQAATPSGKDVDPALGDAQDHLLERAIATPAADLSGVEVKLQLLMNWVILRDMEDITKGTIISVIKDIQRLGGAEVTGLRRIVPDISYFKGWPT